MQKQNKEQGYHISMGADAKMYILNCGEDYVKNLSTDLEIAKIKAKEYLEGDKVNVDIWLRTKYVSPVYVPHTPDWLLFNHHITSYNNHLENLAFNVSKKDCESSQYVGNVGDVLEMELKLTETFNFESEYGFCSCYKFKDSNNNRFIYFGTSRQLNTFKNSGDKFVISFEIKRQFIDENKDVVPFKINQITKVKNKLPIPKEYFVQANYDELDIMDINVEYYSNKKMNFSFSTYNRKQTIPFYPKNIKSFKQAKEFLDDLVNLDNKNKLSKDYLINLQ
jgi:hypothetical protein